MSFASKADQPANSGALTIKDVKSDRRSVTITESIVTKSGTPTSRETRRGLSSILNSLSVTESVNFSLIVKDHPYEASRHVG